MRWVLLLMLTGTVATCGQKGPLEPPAQATFADVHWALAWAKDRHGYGHREV